MKRAVIFDFDGTIADSFATVIAIAHKLTRRPQLADIEYVKVMRNKHMGLKHAVLSLNIPRWHLPWLVSRGRRIMSQNIHVIPVFSGIGEVLKKLNQEHYQLFIVTSNSKRNVERFLSEKGLQPYFKKVYGGASLFGKGRLIKKVLSDNSLKPDSAIYVGDEDRDIVMAQQYNLPVIGVTWGYNSEDLLRKHQPTDIVRTPNQLFDAILALNNNSNLK
jgi:phosphoglycolate phosphatase